MATTVRYVVEEVMRHLQEAITTAGTRWKVAEIVRYLNAGQDVIAQIRPDIVGTTVAAHALAAGTVQTIPTTWFKLFEILNASTGAAIRLVDRKMLDACMPGWRAATPGVTVNYVYDEREPRVFEVYPPAVAAATVRLRGAAYPTDLTVPAESATPASLSESISIPDLFVEPLREYALYRCQAKDAEFSAGAASAARTHLTLVGQALGVEMKALMGTSPRSSDAAANRGVQAGP